MKEVSMTDKRPNESEITVFYAWQTDRDKKANRYLIQDAAERAIKRLTKAPTIPYDLRFDHDTKDIPGMPAITDTILQKIEQAGIFLADLTYVAETDPAECEGRSKPLPNPNVLFELGYAFKVLGHERIICVMNTAYGDAEHQIFDLAHRRWPIRYKLHAGHKTQIASVRDSLSTDIEKAIRDILKSGVVTPQIVSRRQIQEDRLQKWTSDSRERWQQLVDEQLADEQPSRYHRGVWTAAYSVVGAFTPPLLHDFKEILRRVEHHGSGWPVWWAATEDTPFPNYFYENHIECWMKDNIDADAAHSDFWTASPDGLMFLLRGYREDSEPKKVDPGQTLWPEVVAYEVAECLFHARRLAYALSGESASILCCFRWEGLSGRVLRPFHARRGLSSPFWDYKVCRQAAAQSPMKMVSVNDIEANICQVVEDLTRPLFVAFQTSELPKDIIEKAVAELKERLG